MAPGAPITPILGAIQTFKQQMRDGEFKLGLTIIMNDLRMTVRPTLHPPVTAWWHLLHGEAPLAGANRCVVTAETAVGGHHRLRPRRFPLV
jgi:hypothetical protein